MSMLVVTISSGVLDFIITVSSRGVQARMARPKQHVQLDQHLIRNQSLTRLAVPLLVGK